MASFEEILNRPSSESKPPQALPVGTYHCLIDGLPEHGKSSQRQTDYLRAKFKIISAYKDVDPAEALEQQVVGKVFTNDYYMVDGASWRFGELLDHLGIDAGPDGQRSFRERIAEMPGKQVLVTLSHEMSQDGTRKFHRVKSTAAV